MVEKFGTVMNKPFFANYDPHKSIERKRELFADNLTLLKNADCVIANVSYRSLGVGYELAFCVDRKIPILCLCDKNTDHKLSIVVEVNENVELVYFDDIMDVESEIEAFVKRATRSK